MVGDEHREAARASHAATPSTLAMPLSTVISTSAPRLQRAGRRSPASGRSRAPRGRAPRSRSVPRARRAAPGRAGRPRRRWRRRSRSRRRCRCACRRAIASASSARGRVGAVQRRPAAAGAPGRRRARRRRARRAPRTGAPAAGGRRPARAPRRTRGGTSRISEVGWLRHRRREHGRRPARAPARARRCHQAARRRLEALRAALAAQGQRERAVGLLGALQQRAAIGPASSARQAAAQPRRVAVAARGARSERVDRRPPARSAGWRGAAAAEPERVDRQRAARLARLVDRMRCRAASAPRSAGGASGAACARARGSQTSTLRPTTRSSEARRQAGERSACAAYQRLGAPQAQREAVALEQRRAPRRTARAIRRVEQRERLRVGHARCARGRRASGRRDQAPGRGRPTSMPSAAAASAANGSAPSAPRQPQSARQRALVRRRQRVLVAACRAAAASGAPAGARASAGASVGRHLQGFLRQRGGERDQQVHAPIIGAVAAHATIVRGPSCSIRFP